LVQHPVDADSLDTFSKHAFDTSRDDHTQYLLGDGSRAPVNPDSWFGTPSSIGIANAQGVIDKFTRQDHVHQLVIPAGFVTAAMILNDAITAVQIAPDAITASELADNAVDTNAIAATAITIAKLSTALHVGFVAGSCDGSGNFVVAHGCGWTPSAVFVQMITPNGGANAGHPVVTGIGAANFNGRMIGTAGSMAGLAISMYFFCTA
jgi:hypothetical protein